MSTPPPPSQSDAQPQQQGQQSEQSPQNVVLNIHELTTVAEQGQGQGQEQEQQQQSPEKQPPPPQAPAPKPLNLPNLPPMLSRLELMKKTDLITKVDLLLDNEVRYPDVDRFICKDYVQTTSNRSTIFDIKAMYMKVQKIL